MEINYYYYYYCRTSNELDFLNFKKCREKLRSTTRDLRVQYEVDLTYNIKDTPKAFWKYVKTRLKTRTIIPTLTLNDGSTAKTSLDKAEALNNYFGSVQTDEYCTNVPLCEVKYSGIPLSKRIFTQDMVKMKLLNLNRNKSMGPDNIHPHMLKSLADTISKPLAIILNKSMVSGTTPEQWADAIIRLNKNIFRRAHIGQMPTSTIITLSLMATPFSHSPEENVLLRLSSTMVIALGEGAVCHLCTNSFSVFHYIF